ncbi:MAG: hypothetical protein KDA63_11405 [Planctomycetales bacterium]|nr:hypothetical protein [Planctomycetales bacterium]
MAALPIPTCDELAQSTIEPRGEATAIAEVQRIAESHPQFVLGALDFWSRTSE